jgi:23S rRNA (adenine2030-N6)-methyltransferase
MFAYRHAFHAGNHADVMKHVAVIAALELLQKKEAPIWVVDTHAGAGLYALNSPLVRDKAEWPSGIGKLWSLGDMPAPVANYVDRVKAFNKSGRLTHYPGSPLLLQQGLRDEDRLRAFEMHPSDIGPLQQALKGSPRQLKAERKDGFQQLRALLPPTSRRGLILMDPPYEMRDDYRHVITALREGLGRFSTGVYMLWYPKIGRFQVDRLLRQIAGLPIKDVLHATLTVRAPLRDGLGLQGSGLVVINPPFGLKEVLDEAFPFLAKTLGQDKRAGFTVKQSTSPADVKTALGVNTPSAAITPPPRD